MDQAAETLSLVTEIVSAYLRAKPVAPGEVAALIHSVRNALVSPETMELPAVPTKPAVPIRKSVTDDYIVCLEDGMRFKSLKRHLATHGLTLETYREKWALPGNYPIAAPSYSRVRSEVARSSGLGQKGRGASSKARVNRK